nr:hypothetical protein [Nanoarchaeum sp.]
MRQLMKKAMKNKEIALAIIGQAIMDEADIGLAGIKINLVSKSEAKNLWTIANRWNWVNKFRRFVDGEHRFDEWGFSFKADKIKEIYDSIKPLPNKDKDVAFRHLVKHQGKITKTKHGLTKNKILCTLSRDGPMTRRELMYKVDIGYSTLKQHLLDLKRNNLVCICGKNTRDVRHSHRRQADLWSISTAKIA